MTDNHDSTPPGRGDGGATEHHTADPDAEHVPYVLTTPRVDDGPYHVHTTWRPDWKPGHRCPVCGSSFIVALYICTELARHHNSQTEVVTSKNPFGVLAYQCADCETVLHWDVAFDLWTTLREE